MPVQKLTNPVEQIRDKESCVQAAAANFLHDMKKLQVLVRPTGRLDGGKGVFVAFSL